MKRIVVVTLCVVLAMGLAACGKDAAPGKSGSGPTPSDQASSTATTGKVTFLYFGSPG